MLLLGARDVGALLPVCERRSLFDQLGVAGLSGLCAGERRGLRARAFGLLIMSWRKRIGGTALALVLVLASTVGPAEAQTHPDYPQKSFRLFDPSVAPAVDCRFGV